MEGSEGSLARPQGIGEYVVRGALSEIQRHGGMAF